MKRIILSSIVMSSLAFANSHSTKTYEISPVVGKIFTKDDVKLKDHNVGGLFVAKDVEHAFFDQLELGLLFGNADYEKELNPTGSSDVTRFLVGGIKNYPITEKFGLFGALGVGYEKIKNELHDDKSRILLNYGLGLKYKITDNFGLRSDLRHLIKADGDKNILLSVGLSIPFGGEKTTKPQKENIKKQSSDFKSEVAKKREKVEEQIEVTETKVQKKIEQKVYVPSRKIVVFFGFDSDKITPEYEGQIKTFANKRVNKENDTIILTGYTDSIGSVEYNKELAKRRVLNVVHDLTKHGIKEDKLNVKYLGEEFDAINKETIITRKNNRKVEITIK